MPTIGNLDVFNYLNYSRLLADPSAAVNSQLTSHYDSFVQHLKQDAYGIFAILAMLSYLFGGNFILSNLVLLVGLLLMFALVCTRLILSMQVKSKLINIFLSCQFISGPFFLYIYLNNFYGQVTSAICFLLMINAILLYRKTKNGFRFIYYLVPSLGIILFSYFSTFLLYVAILGAFSTLYIFFTDRRDENPWLQSVNACLVPWFLAGLILIFVGWERIVLMVHMTQALSSIQAGWSLDYISPISFLGINLDWRVKFERGFWLILLASILFAALLSWLIYRSVKKNGILHEKTALLALFIFCWFAYLGAFVHFGDRSYQQWKFASFLPMLLTPAVGLPILEWIFLRNQRSLKIFSSLIFIIVAFLTLKRFGLAQDHHQIGLFWSNLSALSAPEKPNKIVIDANLPIAYVLISPVLAPHSKILFLGTHGHYPKSNPSQINFSDQDVFISYAKIPSLTDTSNGVTSLTPDGPYIYTNAKEALVQLQHKTNN